MIRWESRSWEATRGERTVHAEFGLHGNCWDWLATRLENKELAGSKFYPNISRLKWWEARWLEGMEA